MFSFPKALRLLERHDFMRVAQKGDILKGKFILIEYTPNQEPHCRLGITATKRFGKAHERNRFKRLVREAFRLSQHQLIGYFDLVIKPRSYAKKACLSDIQEELLRLLSSPSQPNDALPQQT